LGSDSAIKDLEIQKALAAIKKTPGVVDRVIVGNEVVLRNDLTPVAAQRLCRAGQEGSTQDRRWNRRVWNTWLANPEIARKLRFHRHSHPALLGG